MLLSIKQSFFRNCNRKKWPITLCNSISDDHDFVTNCSWLIYYLGKKYEDEFLSVVIELGYPILSQKMDEISAAAMWQESNVTTNAQRIITRHLSDFFGNRLIVPECCITELGQNHVPPKSELIILDDKKIHFWTKPLDKLLTRSLLRKFSETTNDKNLSNICSKIDIVVGSDHGQGNFVLLVNSL